MANLYWRIVRLLIKETNLQEGGDAGHWALDEAKEILPERFCDLADKVQAMIIITKK